MATNALHDALDWHVGHNKELKVMQQVIMNMPDTPEGYEWTGYTERWDKNLQDTNGPYMRVLCKLERKHKEPELVSFISGVDKLGKPTLDHKPNLKLVAHTFTADIILDVNNGCYYLGNWNDGPKGATS